MSHANPTTIDAAVFAAADRYFTAEAASVRAHTSLMDEEAAEAIYSEQIAAFEALLVLTPRTVVGSIAVLRAVQSFSDHMGSHLFCTWYGPVNTPAKTLLSRIADTLERSAIIR